MSSFSAHSTVCFLVFLIDGTIESPSFSSLFQTPIKYIDENIEWRSREPIDRTKVLPVYDFIVVGAGSAGAVVANRLTEVKPILYLQYVFFFFRFVVLTRKKNVSRLDRPMAGTVNRSGSGILASYGHTVRSSVTSDHIDQLEI